MRSILLKTFILLFIPLVLYGVAAWFFVLPGYHYAHGELKRLYIGEPQTTRHYQSRIQKFRKRLAELSTAKIVFLGDSITEGLDVKNLIEDPDVFNFGISGDTTAGVIHRLDLLNKNDADKVWVFLMIGVNDLGTNVAIDQIARNLNEILDHLIANDYAVVLQAVLLTDGRKRDNQKIIELNQKIKKISLQRGLPFLDINPQMVKSGNLNPEYTYDGIHLSKAGYKVWAQAINNYLYDLKDN